MVTLIFARHGESEANTANVIANGNDGYPLTAKGRDQSRILAGRLNVAPIDRVLCSPILRARQTAAIVATAVQAVCVVDDRLRECLMGDLEGRSDPSAWRAHAAVNEEWLHGAWDRRPPNGESMLDVARRFQSLIDELKGMSGRLVLIGHGALYRCMLPFVLSNVSFGFSAANLLGHTDWVEAEGLGTEVVCTNWAGVSFRDAVNR